MIHPMLNIAQKAARKAGSIILRALDRRDTLTINEKSKNDFVTNIDKQAEQEIIYHIRKAYPSHGILAEEGNNYQGDEYTWIIDPLDGTTNFIHGFPHFAISIAITRHKQLEHGLIYNPLQDELFYATRGQGAFLNNHRIRVNSTSKLEQAFLTTGLPADVHQLMQIYLQTLNSLIEQAADIRQTGCASLNLAYVACGRFDGYWEFSLAPWDIAAGVLLVKEAGGFASDFSGEESYLENGNIVAANPKLFPILLKELQKIIL